MSSDQESPCRQRTIILAPHPDDELIGCFSLLSNHQIDYVAYFNELTEERRAEVKMCAAYYGFEPLFIEDVQPDALAYLESLMVGARVYLPAITDGHPAHKALNAKYRARPGIGETQFYQVDMGRGKVILNEETRAIKRKALDVFYPSQRQLWDTDASYYLFENISRRDYEILVTVRCVTLEMGECTVRFPSSVRASVIRGALYKARIADEVVDALISQGVYTFELETGCGEVIKV